MWFCWWIWYKLLRWIWFWWIWYFGYNRPRWLRRFYYRFFINRWVRFWWIRPNWWHRVNRSNRVDWSGGWWLYRNIRGIRCIWRIWSGVTTNIAFVKRTRICPIFGIWIPKSVQSK